MLLERKMQTWGLLVLGCLCVGWGLVGCSKSDSPSVSTVSVQTPKEAKSTESSVPKVALVMKTLTNPFFIEMEKGARRAERELGVALQVRTAAQETSIEQQIQIVNDLIAARVDAIVIAPGDSQSLVATVKKAVDAGIKVVNIDNRLDEKAVQAAGMQAIPFISVDNEAGAYKAGKWLSERVTTPSNAAILEGIRSADNARQRLAGAKRAFAENKNIRLVASETANWKIDEAYAVTKALFAKHPDIRVLFAANDMMALGAVKYLQEKGNTKTLVAGYDALGEVLAEIQAGRMVATVDQQAAEQGFQGVAAAVRLLKGEKVELLTLVDTRLVTAPSAKN